MRIRFLLLLVCQASLAATYEVGPGQIRESIEQVPWTGLSAGDTVLIHWRTEPYTTKWVISVRGTEAAPVTIRGVPGPKGELPIISGIGAVTPPGLDYWGHQRSIIKIGGASSPANAGSSHVIIEKLDIRDARPPFTYTWRKGTGRYQGMAAAIWIENGDHITIRDCSIHDGANGLFISKDARDILVEGCAVFDNGLEKSGQQHNIYAEANGAIYRFNFLGKLRPGCLGNNIKDRSAGTVIACNWIEGGARNIDLVDAEDSESIRQDPKYRKTLVYGNVIIKTGDVGNQIVHYGGDSGHAEWYRKGTLYFYNNTVISRRTGNTTLFRVQTNDEKVDCRNNIIYWTAPGKYLSIVDSVGKVDMVDNWFKKGWVKCHEKLDGTISDKHSIGGDQPGFVNAANNDFHLSPNSPCIKVGELPPEFFPELADEYAPPQHAKKRGNILDLGAFSFGP